MEKYNSLQQFTFLPNPDPLKLQLGQGSYGVVKLAKCNKTNEKFALKIVDTKKLHGSAELDIIRREIKLHSKLNHKNIIKFHGHFQEQNNIVLVLEYAETGNLYQYLKKKKRLEESEAFKYFYQTLQAIIFLHKNDILHRDIKPENLLLDKNLQIKLCDFGWSTEDISLKRTTFCGTYEYMSPEVVFKRPYTENIDVWSLGILLYELVHGFSAFKAKNLNEVTTKIKNIENITFREGLSQGLVNLIKGILKFDPIQRLDIKAIIENSWVKKMVNENKDLLDNNKDFLNLQNFKSEILKNFGFNNEKHKRIDSQSNNPLVLKEKSKTSDNEFNFERKYDFAKIQRQESENLEEKTFGKLPSSSINQNTKLFSYQAYNSRNIMNIANKENEENAFIKRKSRIFDQNIRESPKDLLLKMDKLMISRNKLEKMKTIH